MFLNQDKIDENYKKGVIWGFDNPNKYVIQLANLINSGSRILDLGCGEGRNTIFLAKNGFKLTGIDISETAIAKLNLIIKDLNLEIETIVSKIEDYKFFEKYDCIISTTVIHLLSKKDQLECIQKMKDFTLNGGYNLITVFTKKDPGFIEYPNLSFINLEELQNYYNDKNWSILVADEYIKHETHGVPHDHSIAVLMARKNT